MTRDPRAGCLGLLALLALAIVPLGTPSGMFFPVMVLLAGGCAVLMWRSLPTVNSQDGYAWVAIAITALLLMLGMRMLAYEDPGGGRYRCCCRVRLLRRPFSVQHARRVKPSSIPHIHPIV